MVHEWLENCIWGIVVSGQLRKRAGVLTGVAEQSVLGLVLLSILLKFFCVIDLNILNKLAHNIKLRGNRIPNELDEL